MARGALAFFALFLGHVCCAPSAAARECEADAATCSPAESRGGAARLEADHVLLQISELDRFHASVKRHHAHTECRSGKCPPKHVEVKHPTEGGHGQSQPNDQSQPGSHGEVKVSGRQILVDNQPLHIKGICWSPVNVGQINNPAFKDHLIEDLRMMKRAGINAVRTYGMSIAMDTEVMDAILAEGMWVVPTVYGWGGEEVWKVTAKVNSAKEHKAILMWSIANEWNYNGIYVGLSKQDSMAKINEVAKLIKQADPSRPVTTVYGEVPDAGVHSAMPDIDVWGINAYRGISFGDLLEEWAAVSGKPMYFGEFGADAYNANKNSEDQESQAEATKVLAEEILAASAAQGGVCSGGFLFEWSDEWWKDNAGSAWSHDVGGVAPGGGPYPDKTFNEEWWGIVDVERNPRKALGAYSSVANPNLAPAP